MVFVVYRKENPFRVFAVYDNFAAAQSHKTALVNSGEDHLNIETYGLNVRKEFISKRS